jgi:hypothetical protein
MDPCRHRTPWTALFKAAAYIGKHKPSRNADRHPCFDWDSKPLSQCLRGQRHFPVRPFPTRKTQVTVCLLLQVKLWFHINVILNTLKQLVKTSNRKRRYYANGVKTEGMLCESSVFCKSRSQQNFVWCIDMENRLRSHKRKNAKIYS